MTPVSPPELMEKPKETPTRAQPAARTAFVERLWGPRLADGGLIGLFLILTFLLGAFPLKDVDFHWHLRTGDLIRESGTVPHTDLFTFTASPGTPWIDLHWLFQIAISYGFEHGGVVALNLAKCGITCVAILLLVTARRRDWPVWAMLLAWLPALLVLGGRMYIRPETLSLLYLSIFLAIISRWERFPWLALLLPMVQVVWVNSHGLFVLGPIILVFGLIDAALRLGFQGPERKRWWRTILAASLATGAACSINPYFLTGALYPLELARTMSSPIFSRKIAELTPIPLFIARDGWWNLPLQLHLATMVLGALSFLVPLGWLVGVRLSGSATSPERPAVDQSAPSRASASGSTAAGGKRKSRSKPVGKKGAKSKRSAAAAVDQPADWRLSPFRLLLYVAFCVLSLQATRNSHQFAAVVGTVTAWNFGEWAAAVRRRRAGRETSTPSASSADTPRLIAFGAIALLLLWVGSGQFYRMTGEGRVIGLGEEPLWFPHEAAKFAGKPGMPDRFLSFHNGHASLYEYYHGPERKVYTDPRLEIAGADLFNRYMELEDRLLKNQPGWETELDEMGRPSILVDHEHSSGIGATLMASAHWRCVWFDAIAAVFVHDSYAAIVQKDTVDFAARHFRPAPSVESREISELSALGKAYRNYVSVLAQIRGNLARPLVWLGLADARRILERDPDSFIGWKVRGQIELNRELVTVPTSRFSASYDPVHDLSLVRATYALKHALERDPYDFLTVMDLKRAYDFRLMNEAALLVCDRLVALPPKNGLQAQFQAGARLERAEYDRKLGPAPRTTWQNLSELDRIVTEQLATGRAESAAQLLERANPPERASWEVIDRIATLRLHLGEPGRARALWQKATTVPHPAIRDARIGTTYLVEGNFSAARRFYGQSLQAKPDLFEARYSLAILEQDAGDASAASEQARKAMEFAPDAPARTASRTIASDVARFARPSSGNAATEDRREVPDRVLPARLPYHLEAPAARTGLVRAVFQSLYSDLSSSTVTPPWSSPESQRAINVLWRSRSGPRGRNLPWNFLSTLRRGSAGGRGAGLAFSFS
jgi:tetratricopeptide (TPR) repeat protein